MLGKSPIDYFSDLFIVAMVIMWIFDSVYESIIATYVTISSIQLSRELGFSAIDTSMWSSIGTNISVPLGAGGAVWLIKCGVQRAIRISGGKKETPDFPDIDVGETDGLDYIDIDNSNEEDRDDNSIILNNVHDRSRNSNDTY